MKEHFNQRMEKLYRKIKKSFEDGKITIKQFREQVDSLHFVRHDGQCYQLGYDGTWLVFDILKQQWADAREKIAALRKRRKRLIEGIISVILIISLVLAAPYFWQPIKTALNIEASKRMKTEQTMPVKPLSTIPAYESILCPGITIKAPAGSLNGAEKFAANEIAKEAAGKIAEDNGISLPVVHAFEFHAGMSEQDSFKKPVTLEVSMEKMGIPEALQKDLIIFRIGDNVVQQLSFQVEKGVLKIQTSKNSVIVTCSLLAVLAGAVGYFFYDRQQEKYGSAEYIAYQIPGEKYKNYNILWSKNHPYNQPQDDSKLAEMKKDIDAILKKSSIKWSEEERQFIPVSGSITDMQQYYYAMMDIKKTPEYKRLEKRLNDIDFLMKYYYPEKVVLVVRAVINAHDYMFEIRGLEAITDQLDVLLLDPWPYEPGASGMAVDAYTRYPYIAVNLPYLQTKKQVEDELQPFIDRGMGQDKINDKRNNYLSLMKASHDELQGTLLHEMFHIVQSYYKDNWVEEDLSFCESTAVLIESEGVKYWRKKGKMELDDYALPDNNYFELLETQWGNDGILVSDDAKTTARKQGYTFYNILAFNRDHFSKWKNNGDDFLKNVMVNYKSSDPQTALFNTSYPGMISDYTKSNAQTILNRLENEKFNKTQNYLFLNSSNPITGFSDAKYQPYSLKAFRLNARSQSLESAVLIWSDIPAAVKQNWLNLRISEVSPQTALKLYDIPIGEGLYIIPTADDYLLLTQDLTQEAKANMPEKAYSFNLLLIEQPQNPYIEYDNKKMEYRIQFPEKLANTSLYRGRILEFKPANDEQETTKIFLPAGTNEIKIPVERLLKDPNGKVSVLERLIAKAIHTAFLNSFRMVKRMPMPEDSTEGRIYFEEYGDMIKIRIDKPAEEKKDKDEEFIDREISIQTKAEDGIFYANSMTDKGYYLNLKIEASKIIDYLFYAKYLFRGIRTEFAKEFEKYEKGFTLTVKEVYSVHDYEDSTEVPSYKNSIFKSAKSISGPAGEPVELKPNRPDYTNSIPPGIYSGSMFISFMTNMSKENTSNLVTAEVYDNNEVKITTMGESMYGRLQPADESGRFQYYARDRYGKQYQYRMVQGATAVIASDGTLVFSFVPALLKRN